MSRLTNADRHHARLTRRMEALERMEERSMISESLGLMLLGIGPRAVAVGPRDMEQELGVAQYADVQAQPGAPAVLTLHTDRRAEVVRTGPVTADHLISADAHPEEATRAVDWPALFHSVADLPKAEQIGQPVARSVTSAGGGGASLLPRSGSAGVVPGLITPIRVPSPSPVASTTPTVDIPSPLQTVTADHSKGANRGIVAMSDSGGGTPPTTVITDNISGAQYRGGRAKFTVSVGSGYTIKNVDWTTGGMVDNLKTPSVADGTFVYLYTTLANDHDSQIEGYWGPSGGSSPIRANVTSEDAMGNTHHTFAEKSVAFSPVTISLTVVSRTSAMLDDDAFLYPFTYLAYGNNSFPGVDWSLAPSVGTANTVQIITSAGAGLFLDTSNPEQPDYIGLAKKNSDGTLTHAPFPLVDHSEGDDPFYPSTSDHPGIPLYHSMQNAYMFADFTDHVMHKPPDGIWVPFGLWTWEIFMRARDTTMSWTAASTTVTTLGDVVGQATAFASSGSIPTWNDSSRNWNDLVWTRATPPPPR